MNLCQDHWDRLKAMIEARGLMRFVPSSGAEAHRRMVGQIESSQRGEAEVTRSTFDPLLGASNALLANCMEAAPNPLALLCVEEGSERPPCPLCFCNKGRHGAAQQAKAAGEEWAEPDNEAFFDVWMERAVQDQVNRAIELGLLAQG